MSNSFLQDPLKDDNEEDLSGYPLWMRKSPETMSLFDSDLAFRVKCYNARSSPENQQVIIKEAERVFEQ